MVMNNRGDIDKGKGNVQKKKTNYANIWRAQIYAHCASSHTGAMCGSSTFTLHSVSQWEL